MLQPSAKDLEGLRFLPALQDNNLARHHFMDSIKGTRLLCARKIFYYSGKQHEHHHSCSELHAGGPKWKPTHSEGCMTGKELRIFRTQIIYKCIVIMHILSFGEKHYFCLLRSFAIQILWENTRQCLASRARRNMRPREHCFPTQSHPHSWKEKVYSQQLLFNCPELFYRTTPICEED